MNVILPLDITETVFTYSNVVEPDVGEVYWNPIEPYTLGFEVIRPNHNKYKNILAGADLGVPELTPDRWRKSGVTNKWAAIDTLRNTQSQAVNQLVMKFMPDGFVDSIGLGGLEGTKATIELRVEGGVVYTYTQDLFRRVVTGWYDYFFEKHKKIESIVRLDMPIYSGSEITVIIDNPGAWAKCGAVIFGKKLFIGRIEYGASGDDLNFSKFDRAFDGTSELLQRRSLPTVDGVLMLDKSEINKVRDAKKALNAKPTVWTGLGDENINDFFELFLIFGIYKQFTITAESFDLAKITLKLEEY